MSSNGGSEPILFEVNNTEFEKNIEIFKGAWFFKLFKAPFLHILWFKYSLFYLNIISLKACALAVSRPTQRQ